MMWAAGSKDEGYTPELLLSMAKRHIRYREEDLWKESLTQQVTLIQTKESWIAAADEAEHLFSLLTPRDVGCLNLDGGGNVVTLDPARLGEYRRHYASVGGSTPQLP